jgi:hypothetical protein
VTQTMYTHVSKCKNDKRKEKRNFDLLWLSFLRVDNEPLETQMMTIISRSKC